MCACVDGFIGEVGGSKGHPLSSRTQQKAAPVSSCLFVGLFFRFVGSGNLSSPVVCAVDISVSCLLFFSSVSWFLDNSAAG